MNEPSNIHPFWNSKKQANPDDCSKFAEQYIDMVHEAARRFVKRYEDGTYSNLKPEEFLATGWQALLRSVKYYDPQKGSTFKKYAQRCILNSFNDQIKELYAIRIPDQKLRYYKQASDEIQEEGVELSPRNIFSRSLLIAKRKLAARGIDRPSEKELAENSLTSYESEAIFASYKVVSIDEEGNGSDSASVERLCDEFPYDSFNGPFIFRNRIAEVSRLNPSNNGFSLSRPSRNPFQVRLQILSKNGGGKE